MCYNTCIGNEEILKILWENKMPQEIKIEESSKSYIGRKQLKNVIDSINSEGLRYIIVTRDDGRLVPVFLNAVSLELGTYLARKGFLVVG